MACGVRAFSHSNGKVCAASFEKIWRKGKSPWRLYGKVKRKCGAFAQRRFNFDTSAMSSRNSAHGRKSQPGSSGPRSKKWMEDTSEVFFTNAVASVRHFDDCLVFKFRVAIVLSDTNLDLAISVCRVDGVDNQVKHSVFNQCRVKGNHYRIFRRFEFNRDPMATRGRVRCLRAG